MNRNENVFKSYLVRIMGTMWDVQSHEDKHVEGIPDLSFGCDGVGGWIELKYIEKWSDHLTKPKKYTAQQVNWLMSRGKKNPNCFVFVKVGKDEYFLFRFTHARKIRLGMTRYEYETCNTGYWKGSVSANALTTILSGEYEC